MFIGKTGFQPLSHTVIGNVTKGIQLMDIVGKGDKITVQTIPKRIMTLGLTQKEAGKLLKSRGIAHVREGSEDDEAIVVTQDPKYTMGIIDQKQVKTIGVPDSKIVYVEIYDKAPRICMVLPENNRTA